MSLRYLLDANAVSEPIRARPNRGFLRRLTQNQARVAIPAPAWHELLRGAFRLPPSRRRQAIEEYLLRTIEPFFPILPYDAACAAWHARERARLEASGKTPAYIDGQIGAIASVHELTLVTANEDDFADFEGLAVENWLLD